MDSTIESFDVELQIMRLQQQTNKKIATSSTNEKLNEVNGASNQLTDHR